MKSLNIIKKFCKIVYYGYTKPFSVNASSHSHRHIKIEKEHKFVTQEFVPNLILQNKIETHNDWNKIRQELLNSSKQITLKTIDSIILSICISSHNYKLGFSYMDFVKHQNINLGLAALGKYLKLFYLDNCNKTTINCEREIFNLYQELRVRHKVFDASTCENIIHALSITSYWKECLSLLKELKISDEASSATYSVIAAACFKNKDLDLGWELLNECANRNRLPHTISYIAYINMCEQANKPLDKMEKLYEFFRIHDIQCENDVANGIVCLYHKLEQTAKCVEFHNKRAICTHCDNSLQKLELTNDQFKELKDAVFKNVIVGSNVFYKSTPAELEKFKKFTTKMKKYDVVIDGLNVAYSVGTNQSTSVLSFFVKSVVKHFVDKNLKVLLFGRTHMQKWPGWSYVSENADCFLAQSLSHDDPYLLYSALHCGINTIIVSRDLMRSHIFKLSNIRLKIIFNQWLLQNQYQVLHITKSGKVNFKDPLPYARTAQKSGNIWHIPCSASIENTVNTWLCLNNQSIKSVFE